MIYNRNHDGSLYSENYSHIPVGHRLYAEIVENHTIIDIDRPSVSKLKGVLFDGVMCSATAEDQHGLSDIESFVMGGQPVYFSFENGNKLVLTSSNWVAFRTAWVTFRQSFFPLP